MKIPDPRAHDAQDGDPGPPHGDDEENEVLRRAFTTHGPAAAPATPPPAPPGGAPRRIGDSEARAVEESVRHIRVLDDRHGADGLYQRAGHSLRGAYALLDEGAFSQPVADRLYSGAGELAISVGWLAHDSGRFGEARSLYAEALATARAAGDPALEAHAFCNISFLARDDDRPREAVRAAQAAQQAAARLGSPRLLSLLALREAGGWAGLGDRAACERALLRARQFHGRGIADADPEWMSFYGEAELEGLEAQAGRGWATTGARWRTPTGASRSRTRTSPATSRSTTPNSPPNSRRSANPTKLPERAAGFSDCWRNGCAPRASSACWAPPPAPCADTGSGRRWRIFWRDTTVI